MFVDFEDRPFLPPRPPEPEPHAPRKPQLTRRQQGWLMRLVLANMLLLFVAPIAGGSVIAGIIALFN